MTHFSHDSLTCLFFVVAKRTSTTTIPHRLISSHSGRHTPLFCGGGGHGSAPHVAMYQVVNHEYNIQQNDFRPSVNGHNAILPSIPIICGRWGPFPLLPPEYALVSSR